MEATTYGAWTVQQVDETGRRAWVICKCGTVRQIALGASRAARIKAAGV